MQSRSSDLDEFFSHEIQSYPPALSDFGKLHTPSAKSELLKSFVKIESTDELNSYDCKILDGAAIVHSLTTNGMATFDDYADRVFIPHIVKHLRESKRLDLVWDSYIPDSLKESTREKRGKGLRRKVSGQAKLPGNWKDFLRDNDNKKELFQYLTSKVSDMVCPAEKVVFVTNGSSVIRVSADLYQPMSDCNHEEADTRIVVHVLHALNHGCVSVSVRTVDTDVIVILLGSFHHFIKAQPSAKVLVEFGRGENFRVYDINTISVSLGSTKSRALPVFHALSGSDTTSAFKGKGKKSAWQAWQAYDEVTNIFCHLADHPFLTIEEHSDMFAHIERLIVLLYDKSSVSSSVNSTRKELFCQKKVSMERLPPTKNALLNHVKRAIYQAGIWTTSTIAQQSLPSPENFGWTKVSQAWIPQWITVPEVSVSCRELIRCSCKGDCSKCKCGKANLNCSPLCKCNCEK